ncbi:porin [Rheinheimera riviphila]|uniref:Porin n=1 Tax=Rheinheimera riviphila TaxID=1834037 RepID=A0A437QSL8_9GAMM|nr:porin [Rheinheimera riviphila]RVU37506.1 porin [Rheinheimera riviphila]
MPKFKLGAVATLLMCSGAAPAAEFNPKLAWYGKLDVQALSVDQGLFRYADQGHQLEMPFSRLGLKGKQALTDDLALIFVYEWQVNGLDDANREHRLGARNTYIGLSGSFGELIFGKNDTKFKKSEGKADLFNEYIADIAQLTAGQDRLKNIIGYQSPQWAGFSVAASYQTAVDKEQAGGHDLSLSYGDSALKKYPLFLSVSLAKELNNLNAERVLLQWPLWRGADSLWAAAVMWQHSEHQINGKSGTARLAQLSYQQSSWTTKLQWQQDHSRLRQQEAATLQSVGVDYQLRSDVTLYGLASRLKLETDQDHALAIGIKYSF